MGLLDELLGGGSQQGKGGGLSPIALALIAMLAQRGMSGGQPGASGGGGLGDLLGGLLGGGRPQPGGAQTTGAPAGGGLGDLLGGLLGGLAQGQRPGAAPGGSGTQGGGGLGDLLGSVLGGSGAAGPRLNGGLSDLLRQFEQNGMGDAAGSWVGRGQNQRLAPEDVERALGRGTVESLSRQTGQPYLDVLSDLSESLPDTVDRLTPQGRLATEQEASRWI